MRRRSTRCPLAVIAGLAAAACGGSPTPSPVAFNVPLQPYVEDCPQAHPQTGCTLEAVAPVMFRIVSADRPALPARLPVARYRPLTAATALDTADRLFGPGWQVTSASELSPESATAIEIDLARGGERVAVRGRTMTARYSTPAPACRPAGRQQVIAASRAWLAGHEFPLDGLSPTASPPAAGCGSTVTWTAPAFGPDSLRHAAVDLSGTTVTSAEESLAPEATRELPFVPLARAAASAPALGSGPVAEAHAGFGYVTELGSDGAWYVVPAAIVTTTGPPAASGRIITAVVPLG